jgi:hypothetical protein
MRPGRIELGDLPDGTDQRRIHLSNAFGRVLLDNADAADDVLYSVLQLLDGVTPPIANDSVRVEFVLTARVRDLSTNAVVDAVELAPDGEGLCMGYAGWIDGDFGSVPR